MKTKTLYAIVFILAVIIMFTLIYSRGKIAELNQVATEESQVEAIKNPETTTQHIEPVFFHKEAITIIKPAQAKQAAVLELEKAKDIENQQDSNLSSQDASVAAGGGTNSQAAEEVAGVTRSNKYPTKEELKEMRSKGIVMY